jgi:hypothetical protein
MRRSMPDKTIQIFVVKPGQEFEIQISGPGDRSIADPTGSIGGVVYRYQADPNGLIQLGAPYRLVAVLREDSVMLERKPL